MLLLFSTNAFSGVIGDVILQEGNSIVERKEGDEFESKKDLDIFSYDTVKTGKGKTAIEFIDETRYEQVLVHWDELDYEDHGTPADMGYIGRIREWMNVNNLEVAQ